jgi:L,D-transpeptidase ErfK/SrfK
MKKILRILLFFIICMLPDLFSGVECEARHSGQGAISHIDIESRTVVVEIPSGIQMFTVGGQVSVDARLIRDGSVTTLKSFSAGDIVRIEWSRTITGHVIESLMWLKSSGLNDKTFSSVYPSGSSIGESAPIGAVQHHIIGEKETLLDIAYMYGLGFNEIQDMYPELDPWIPPRGMELIIPTQWIVPEIPKDGIVINIPELRLYCFFSTDDKPRTYPIGIGDIDWRTPEGVFSIKEKRIRPTWYIPASLQHKYNTRAIPPGPENPLGDYWMGIGDSYGIHGTDIPWSVGRLVTHGCIRMYPADIEALFPAVKPGTKVKIIYEPVKLCVIAGRVYVEIHKDIYNKYSDLLAYGFHRLYKTGILEIVDENKFVQAIRRQDGMPVDITRLSLADAGIPCPNNQ